jgi:hypothetical protein
LPLCFAQLMMTAATSKTYTNTFYKVNYQRKNSRTTCIASRKKEKVGKTFGYVVKFSYLCANESERKAYQAVSHTA